jgi:glycosyltransferase involved in cell wall biosynthesis
MKTAFLIPGPIEERSGGYLYDRYLIDRLGKNCRDVDIYSLDGGGKDALIKVLVDGDYDLIIEDELAHEYLTPVNRSLLKEVDPILISVVHNLTTSLIPERRERIETKKKESAYFDTIRGFVANSEATADSVRSLTGRDMEHVVAYPGKDHMEYSLKREGPSDSAIRILHVGNLRPYKGLENLIKALEKIESSSWELDIAGRYDLDPFFKRTVDEIINRYELNTHIHVLGDLGYRQLKNEYENSDIFCMVSFHEGWGISIVEAMGFSLPVITTGNGGPSEIITDGKEGFLVDPFDVEMISDRIQRLMNDIELMTEMGSLARERFLELPDWDESMEKAVSFLSGF